MILVDSSVWIDYFRGTATPQAERLDSLLGTEPIATGFARSDLLRALDPRDDELRGKLPNSGVREASVTGGLSYVGDNGFLGASVSHYSTNYGIPVNIEEPGAPPEVRIAMRQTRADVSGELRIANVEMRLVNDDDFLQRRRRGGRRRGPGRWSRRRSRKAGGRPDQEKTCQDRDS